MRHNVCIHVGLPKTGTTFLQEEVFPNLSQVNYLGKRLALRETRGVAYLSEGISQFCHALLSETIHYREHEQRRLFERHVEPALEDKRINLVSEESFSDGTVDRGLIAERFCDLFGPVKFLIAIRRQQDLAQSMYSDFLKRIPDERTRHLNFDRWLEMHWRRLQGSWFERSELVRFQYYDLVAHYARLVGRDNVGVLVFEEMKDDPPCFTRRLAGFLGVDEAETEAALAREAPADMNTRASRSQRLAIRVGALAGLNGSVGDFLPRPVKTAIKGVVDRGDAKSIRLSAEWSDRIGELCRWDNERLAREWDLPLERHGYFL